MSHPSELEERQRGRFRHRASCSANNESRITRTVAPTGARGPGAEPNRNFADSTIAPILPDSRTLISTLSGRRAVMNRANARGRALLSTSGNPTASPAPLTPRGARTKTPPIQSTHRTHRACAVLGSPVECQLLRWLQPGRSKASRPRLPRRRTLLHVAPTHRLASPWTDRTRRAPFMTSAVVAPSRASRHVHRIREVGSSFRPS